MPFLRQSTIQTIRFGPFLDITDGVTEEVALTITQALRRLSKDGGDFAQSSESGNSTHDENGWYFDDLTVTDTNTVGELILYVQDPTNTLPVWVRWWVLEEAVYDAVYGASAEGPLQATTVGNTLDVNASGEAGLDLDNTSGTIDAAQIGTNAITNTKIAADAIGSSEIATNAIGNDELASGAIGTTTFVASAITSAVMATGSIGADEMGADAIDSSVLAASAIEEISRAINPQVNTAFSNVTFEMYDDTNHNPATGLTVTGERSLDGAAYGAVTGTIAEISDGTYQFDADAADINGALVVWRFSSAGADDTFVHIKTAA